MKIQLTDMKDGKFEGNMGSQTTTPGDASTTVTQGHFGHQSENAYTSYKSQMTQPGWDGTFVGISIPSPTTSEGDAPISVSSVPSHSFAGFNMPGEASGPAGPNFSPSNSQPDSGQFPGVGNPGKGGFGSRG